MTGEGKVGRMPKQLHFPWIPLSFQRICCRSISRPRGRLRPGTGRDVKRKRKERIPSNQEKSLMRGLDLKNVRQLDKLFRAPVSEYAASHSAPPDEEYELAERMYEEADRQWEAQQRFDSLLESKYLN